MGYRMWPVIEMVAAVESMRSQGAQSPLRPPMRPVEKVKTVLGCAWISVSLLSDLLFSR